jgi:hypothetical protein
MLPVMTEELALDERRRKRGAVHDQERFVAPGAASMNRTRKSSFPVPVSPVSSTVLRVGATSAMRARHARMGGLEPNDLVEDIRDIGLFVGDRTAAHS